MCGFRETVIGGVEVPVPLILGDNPHGGPSRAEGRAGSDSSCCSPRGAGRLREALSTVLARSRLGWQLCVSSVGLLVSACEFPGRGSPFCVLSYHEPMVFLSGPLPMGEDTIPRKGLSPQPQCLCLHGACSSGLFPRTSGCHLGSVVWPHLGKLPTSLGCGGA